MAERGENRLPIFELPMVILPGELLALHIFEERYKRMIGWCLESEEPFGIVFRDDDGSARRVGCTARVTEVLERFDDGRLNVVVAGEQPFRVLERWEESEYPAGEIDPITAEEELDETPDTLECEERAAATREAFADLVRRVSGSDADPDETEGGSAYAIAARVELPAETKQRLLELRSETERMRVLGEALNGLMEALRRSREIAERATLNGKLVIG